MNSSLRSLLCGLATTIFVAAGTVRAGDGPQRVSFVNDVQPVLSKAGCNQGTCHGNAGGKGGFKLSLRGFAPEWDYDAIALADLGRRLNRVNPEQSLLLLKPSLTVPHQGGHALPANSEAYRVLLAWVRQGAPGLDPKTPHPTALEVSPDARSLEAGEEVPLRVHARFSDGGRRDVTAWARYDTSDATVVTVDSNGLARAAAPGRAAVSVVYQDQVAGCDLTVPFPAPERPVDYDRLPRANFIDELVIDQWRQLRLTPAARADDATFLRRAFLDLTGTLPSAEQVERFLSDPNPDKRAALIDRLLDSPEYVDHWVAKWSDVFRVSREWLGEKSVWTFHHYLRDRVARNVPWDAVARELVTGAGDSGRDGPPNFYRLQKVFNEAELWPLTAAETTAQTFLGIRLQCARCHNHPQDRWTQADYYGLANCFARVGSRPSADGSVVIFDGRAGEIVHPRLGRALPPKALGGPALTPGAAEDPRAFLARWITASDNPYFARVTANRLWKHFLGRGLVEPVDDLRAGNPASNPRLLDALARGLVANRFDLKQLMRTVCRSNTYQLSATPPAPGRDDGRYFTHYLPKRLTAEQLFDALTAVTGRPVKFPGLPAGLRAQQLPDTRVAVPFLDAFGRPLRRLASCDCERVQEPNLGQALRLMHDPWLQEAVTADGGPVGRLVADGAGDAAVLDGIYLRCLARPPRPAERTSLLKLAPGPAVLPGRPDARREFFEDVLWSLLNSKEFLFIH